MPKKAPPTKICTVCGRVWTKSPRLTKAVFEAREHCGLSKCRRTLIQESAPPKQVVVKHTTDSGWTERPNGNWRPPGWPDEPVILIDTSDYASIEDCTEHFTPTD